MKILHTNLGINSYDILINRGLIENIGAELKKIYNNKKVFVVTDENVAHFYGDTVLYSLKQAGYETYLFALKPGEKTKNFDSLIHIYEHMLKFGLTRGEMVVALGGGVVGDVTGFSASTFLRGVPYVQVPTSLLAQVDSSVGGKVAVDLREGKNLVGSFYQPKLVLIDPDVLNTLSDKFFLDGLGEVIKYALIGDKRLYSILTGNVDRKSLSENIEEIIFRSCDLKRGIVENDEYDTGDRMLLNFGHTLAHAIEKYHSYEYYTHGQAVCVGMSVITQISESLGLTAKGSAEKVCSLIKSHKLDIYPKEPVKNYLSEIIYDKKMIAGKMNIVILKDISHAEIIQIPDNFIKTAESLDYIR